MENNKQIIEKVVEVIEQHLSDETLNLDFLAQRAGYSKYHLHRMFTLVVGLSVHQYIQRRRLTEAAYKLIFTNMPIIEIALCAGYETQRSFSIAFKVMFRCSPHLFRRRKSFLPLQLKYTVHEQNSLRGDRMMEIKKVNSEAILLVGYRKNTKAGFKVIGKCWYALHKNKKHIIDRVDESFLIGVNDYSDFEMTNEAIGFNYMAGAEVRQIKEVPKGMESMILPPSWYVVFSFRGKPEASLEPVVNYIYKEWFPQSTCQLNEHNRYDFTKYGEVVDEKGESDITFWVPIMELDGLNEAIY